MDEVEEIEAEELEELSREDANEESQGGVITFTAPEDTLGPAQEEPEEVESAIPIPLASPNVLAPTPEVKPPERIVVRIKERGTYIDINSTHSLPANVHIINCMPATYSRKIPKSRWRYLLENLIYDNRAFIPFSIWADAITQATYTSLKNKEIATSEILLQPNTDYGYLAIGDSLYKLNPVGLITKSKALAVTRKAMLEKSTQETNELKRVAETAARAMIRAAEDKKEAIDRSIANSLRVNKPMPKSLVNTDWPVRYYNEKWEVGFVVNIQIKEIVAEVRGISYRIPVELQVAPLPTLLWLPITYEGNYAITSTKVANGFKSLPHVVDTGACMAPSELPKVVKSSMDIQQIRTMTEICLSTINLSSLYSTPDQWHPVIAKTLPEEVKANIHCLTNYLPTRAEWVVTQENTGEWTAPTQDSNL